MNVTLTIPSFSLSLSTSDMFNLFVCGIFFSLEFPLCRSSAQYSTLLSSSLLRLQNLENPVSYFLLTFLGVSILPLSVFMCHLQPRGFLKSPFPITTQNTKVSVREIFYAAHHLVISHWSFPRNYWRDAIEER